MLALSDSISTFARRRTMPLARHHSFLIAWLIAGPIMAYLPLVINRRLIAGWQIPLCIFGAYALLRLIDSKVPLRRTIAVGALALVGRLDAHHRRHGDRLCQHAASAVVSDRRSTGRARLAGPPHTDRDVVLSDWRFGNLLPIYADARVFVGHPIETIGFKEKSGAGRSLFRSGDVRGRSAGVDRSLEDHAGGRPYRSAGAAPRSNRFPTRPTQHLSDRAVTVDVVV